MDLPSWLDQFFLPAGRSSSFYADMPIRSLPVLRKLWLLLVSGSMELAVTPLGGGAIGFTGVARCPGRKLARVRAYVR